MDQNLTNIVENPLILLTVDGQSIAAEIVPREVRVRQRLALPTQCEIYYRWSRFEVEADIDQMVNAFGIGARLEVALPGEGSLFQGEITAAEIVYTDDNQQEVYVRAYDYLHRLRKRQSVRPITGRNLERLVMELVRRTRISSVRIIDTSRRVSLKPMEWPLIIQHQQTDYDILVEMASLQGLYPVLQGTHLYLVTLAGFPDPPINLELRDTLTTARFEVNAESAASRVEAVGWDSGKVKAFHASRDNPRSGRQVGAEIDPGRFGSSGTRQLVNENAPGERHIQEMAQAELDLRKAGEVVMWGRATGNRHMGPGQRIFVNGVAESLRGEYTITEATHTLNANEGYITEISTAPPVRTPRPRTDVATFGVVKHVDDPRGWGRVKVTLPMYYGVETEWLQVVCPGAGRNKGFVSLPNVGDKVLVILTRENPAQGVVLGGLYGEERTPNSDLVPDTRTVRYTWRTASGQKIQLNETGDIVRIENQAGAYIELNDGTITIAGNAIDFRQL